MKTLNQRLADGDPDAFAEWYDAIAGSVYHYLLTQTGTSHDAADILQDTFVRLYRHRSKLCQVTNLRAYTFRAARNEWARWLDKKQRVVPICSTERWFEPTINDPSENHVDAEELERALRRLAPNSWNCGAS
jgi:RNA polymerase sigma-70 factor (ECF subfamily)